MVDKANYIQSINIVYFTHNEKNETPQMKQNQKTMRL